MAPLRFQPCDWATHSWERNAVFSAIRPTSAGNGLEGKNYSWIACGLGMWPLLGALFCSFFHTRRGALRGFAWCKLASGGGLRGCFLPPAVQPNSGFACPVPLVLNFGSGMGMPNHLGGCRVCTQIASAIVLSLRGLTIEEWKSLGRLGHRGHAALVSLS